MSNFFDWLADMWARGRGVQIPQGAFVDTAVSVDQETNTIRIRVGCSQMRYDVADAHEVLAELRDLVQYVRQYPHYCPSGDLASSWLDAKLGRVSAERLIRQLELALL